jgi:hypothetical protein
MTELHLDERKPYLRCRPIDPAVVRFMASILKGQTDERLNEQFGISYNTWCKLRKGEPIRISVADRLERRVERIAECPRGGATGSTPAAGLFSLSS